MRSEVKKTFQHGFDLDEQELRRIVDSLSEQMKRVCQDTPPNISFEVKFQNGVIANPASLEEVFALENIGSGAIIRLLIRLEESTEESSSSINLEFVDANTEPGSDCDAISYSVVGDDRDWVFVTGSQLEERLSRIKRFAVLNRFTGRGNRFRVFLMLFMLIFLILAFTGMYYSMSFLIAATGQMETRLQRIDSLEARWKNGELTDPIEVILELERMRTSELDEIERFDSPFELVRVTAVPISILILLVIAMYSWAVFSPAYNFVWGDYTRIYEKRKATGKFILVGIILAIGLGVLANYFTVLLGIR